MQLTSATERRILQDLTVLIENAHAMIEQISAEIGYYPKRAGDIFPGDECRSITGEWQLVVGTEASATRDGQAVTLLTLDFGTEEDGDWTLSLDPQEWVDVKARPGLDAF